MAIPSKRILDKYEELKPLIPQLGYITQLEICKILDLDKHEIKTIKGWAVKDKLVFSQRQQNKGVHLFSYDYAMKHNLSDNLRDESIVSKYTKIAKIDRIDNEWIQRASFINECWGARV